MLRGLSFVVRGFPSSFAASLRHSGESRNPGGGRGGTNHTANTSNDQVVIAGTSRHTLESPRTASFRPLNSSFPRRRESRGGVWGQMTRTQLLQSAPRFSYLGVPAPAGISDCYESMSQTPIRDRPFQQPLIGHSRHPLVTPAPRFVIPANACPVPRYGAGIQRGRGEGIVALGLVPSLGRAARSRTLHRPAYHHFHPLMRPSQGHGDSGESTSRTPIRGRNPEGQGKGKTAQRRGKT